MVDGKATIIISSSLDLRGSCGGYSRERSRSIVSGDHRQHDIFFFIARKLGGKENGKNIAFSFFWKELLMGGLCTTFCWIFDDVSCQ